MIRISLLVWLFLPTVLSTLFNKPEDQAGCGSEFVCIVRRICKDDGDRQEMVDTVERGSYHPELCDIHVKIKQYNLSSYSFRSITSSNQFKVVQGTKEFGCEMTNDGKPTLIPIDDSNIKLEWIKPPTTAGIQMRCEFYVTFTDGKEIFPKEDMQIKYMPEPGSEKELTIKSTTVTDMNNEFVKLKYQCDPRSIHLGGSDFEPELYSLLPITADIHGGNCSSHKKKGYKMVFKSTTGDIEEAESIVCAEEQDSSGKGNGIWKYSIPNVNSEKIPDELQAACRMKTCKLCTNPSMKCNGNNCPIFSLEDDCNRLRCPAAVNNKNMSIVELDGGNRTIGKFECTPDANDEKKGYWIFHKNEDTGHAMSHEAKNFTTAICYEELDCFTYSGFNCDEKKECPVRDPQGGLTCAKGLTLELTSISDEIIKPKKVKCDGKKGHYLYTTEDSDAGLPIDKYRVACASISTGEAKASFPIWLLAVGIVVVLIVIVLILLCIFCIRRSKKADVERRALLKKNDSTPSSTDSTKPPNQQMVHMQPCSTARQISSEQISEATAVEKTKKELVEKTMIEPTLDVKTAFSNDKSRQDKRETGSIEAEYIEDAKRSQVEQRKQSELDDAPSVKGSQASKQERKESNFKPRKFDLNEKEKQIAMGKWRKNTDYPTMADIESDWDDDKDGKPPSKTKRTTTKDIPTADTPSVRGNKVAELNEKTAEMDRLLEPLPAIKLQRASSEDHPVVDTKGNDDSQASTRKTDNKVSTLMLSSLDVTQDQK